MARKGSGVIGPYPCLSFRSRCLAQAAGDPALPIQPRRQKEKTSAAAIAAVAVSVPGGTAGCAGAAAGAGRVFEARADRGSSPWAHRLKREGNASVLRLRRAPFGLSAGGGATARIAVATPLTQTPAIIQAM